MSGVAWRSWDVTGLNAYEAFSVSRFKLSCSSDLINV
jgi:hypothetical protein